MHVCFVALKAGPILLGSRIDGHIGGAEAQQALIARELVRRGVRVSVLVHAGGATHQADPRGRCVTPDGIELIETYAPRAGLPGLRFVHPRWTALWRGMARCNADVYYQRGAGCETGQTALFCQLRRRPFVFAVGSDSDCARDLHYLRTAKERWLYRHGLSRAAHVIAQTDTQRGRLIDAFGVLSHVIPSCAPPDHDDVQSDAARPSRPLQLLWVGRLSYEKQPELFVEMAERAADIQFHLVGASNATSDFARGVASRAARVANLTMHGAVPHARMRQFYQHADLLLCTSKWEGFPNTFLEAWSTGTPVVSTVNPDDCLTRYGVGRVGGDAESLLAACRALTGDANAYRACSDRCRLHVRSAHSVHAVVDAYEQIFAALPARRSGAVHPRHAEVRC
ncbi:MAG: Glycosyltransferase Gtf1 [Phycisphaerae bacterium]|nr:Glycosyltransferase Gtf1 [Phycisphaerae bacterium]